MLMPASVEVNNALNKGDKPPITIADKIEVVRLEMALRCAFEVYVSPMQFTTLQPPKL